MSLKLFGADTPETSLAGMSDRHALPGQAALKNANSGVGTDGKLAVV